MENRGGNITVSHSCPRSLYNITCNDQSGAAMDNLTYRYVTDSKGNILNNRLLHVNDGVKNAGGTDIKDQGAYAQTKRSTHNYEYDEVGNLIKDKSEEIAEIRWNVTGKVTDVIRTSVSTKPDLHFAYDAKGNRISKTVINKKETENDKYVTTYYVRDPQGNVLAVYEHKRGESGDGTFTLAEQHLYGASRLGMTKPNLVLSGTGTGSADPTAPAVHYELTNHLGNVLAVITPDASDATQPAIESLTDYYPFGMEMGGRSYKSNDYRFGFTGHEKENDLAEGVYTTEYRLLDTRLGRWMSVDKMAGDFAWMSPYNYCEGNPMMYWDPNGKFGMGTHKKFARYAMENLNISIKERMGILIGTSWIADVTYADIEDIHLDNKVTYENVKKGYEAAIEDLKTASKNNDGKKIGIALHTMGDFYSHTNYGDLYKKYMQNLTDDKNISYDVSDIPTFSEVLGISTDDEEVNRCNLEKWKDFRENYLKNDLRAGTYGGSKGLFRKLRDRNIDKHSKDSRSHGKMNTDSNDSENGGALSAAYDKDGNSLTKFESNSEVAKKDIKNQMERNFNGK